MKQLVQSVRSGELRIVEAPQPEIGPTEVLVRTSFSVVSAGTERAVRQLASASLLQKARARPDLVRQVVRKAKNDGLRNTFGAVQARLDDDMPLGYSASGVAVAVGEHVRWIRPGMRVATGGAGHADLQVVAANLTVPVPEAVSLSDAAFATVAAIALHGLRQAEVGPGGKVCVIGLGLLGQIMVRLARAAGLDVAGIDVKDWTVAAANAAGAYAMVEQGDATTAAIVDWSRGRGVDAVLLTAATPSSDPALRSAAIARDRANIVVVGDVGLSLQRTPLYEKELTLKVARSYGPGRYERSYEEWAVDYPAGHVRWTEGRNLEAVMDLMASGRLVVDDLITHRHAFDEAASAYDVLSDGSARYLGIQLSYSDAAEPARATRRVPPRSVTGQRIGLLGAGGFMKSVLSPAIRSSGLGTIRSVSSAGGVSAARMAEQVGAAALTTDEALADPSIDLVVIATPHDSHADLTVRALEAGKHVFCEKPLAITHDQLDQVEQAWAASDLQLAVGFNRRHSPMIRRACEVLGAGRGPLNIVYRINAGRLPEKHWYHDRRQGGRLIGEVCHFIDTCNAIVGRTAINVIAFGASEDEAILTEAVSVVLAYEDGSSAVISYAPDGHATTPKERIEVLGRGHTVLVDDFRALTVDGQTQKTSPGKGHRDQLRAFADACRRADRSHTLGAVSSMRLTLGAAQSLLDGAGFRPAFAGHPL